MNAVQTLILLACVAVLIVNFLTWRSMRKTCALIAESRRAIDVVNNFTVGDVANVSQVRQAIAASMRRTGRPAPTPADRLGIEPFDLTERS